MTKEEILNRVLTILTPELLHNVSIKEKNTLLNEYKNYLLYTYSSFDDNYSVEKSNILIELLSNMELKKFKNLDSNTKKSLIVKDINKEKFYELSLKAFSYAKNRLENDVLLSLNDYQTLKEELEKTYSLIQPYNKDNMKTELSEAILDLSYAIGKITDMMSLRMGREYKRKNSDVKRI